MKMVFTLILAMSAAGTVPFVICLILFKVMGDRFSAGFQYVCLKLCLALYLIPLPLIKHLLLSLMSEPTVEDAMLTETKEIQYLSDRLLLAQDGMLVTFSAASKIILGICMAVSVFVILHYVAHFVWFKLNLRYQLFVEEIPQDYYYTLKAEMGIRRRVTVCHCTSNLSSFTYGVFHPVIILTNTTGETEKRLILRHELQHIRSNDFFIRILALLAVLLHCFNPFSYFFLQKLEEVQELACDEKVVQRLTPQMAKAYGYLLIQRASVPLKTAPGLLSFSADKKELLKHRIQRIGKRPATRPVTAVLAVFLLCIVAAIPVSAYRTDTLDLRNSNITAEKLNNVDWISWSFEDEPLYEDENEALFKNVDSFFVTEDGEIITQTSSASVNSKCTHTYKKGTYKDHNKKGNNCTVTTYSAKQCTKCRKLVLLSTLQTADYTPCPHK